MCRDYFFNLFRRAELKGKKLKGSSGVYVYMTRSRGGIFHLVISLLKCAEDTGDMIKD